MFPCKLVNTLSPMLPINCMFKSQIDSTDICSEGSDGEKMLLRLEGADPKWLSFFLVQDGSDFTLLHRGISYPAHRSIIFKNMNLHVLDEQEEGCLAAPDELEPQMLTGVLSYLYGLQLRINRSDVLQVLDAVHFLKVSKLKRILEEDILNNFDEYQLFPVLERARKMGLEDVEGACLQQLQLEGFEQMRYAKFQLLCCSEDIFKDVVHQHNERRWEDPAFGLSQKFIQQLIQEYCKHNGFTERKKSQLIKSFNEMSIKSDQPLLGNTPVPPLKLKETNEISIKIYTPRAAVTKQALSPMNYFKSNKEEDSTKSMIMDLTFMNSHRRRKSSKGSETQSSKVCSDVFNLKENQKKNERNIEELKDGVEKMERSLALKETQATNNRYRLSEVQRLLQECENQLMEDNRRFRLLQAKFKRIEERKMRYADQPTQKIRYEDDQDDDSDNDNDSPPPSGKQNPKDENLRVSLIQSKWVCC